MKKLITKTSLGFNASTVEDNYVLQDDEAFDDGVFYLKRDIVNNQFVELATSEELLEHQKQKQLQETLDKYKQYKLDGTAFYDKTQAKIALAVNTGTFELPKAFLLESLIRPYMVQVKSGDWATANYLIQTLTSEDVEVLDWINEIKAFIYIYHSENY